MKDFLENLEEIIKLEINNTNEKLLGINFLENLKFNLIPKIKILEMEKTTEFKNYNKRIDIENKNKKIEINFKYFDKINKTEKTKINQNILIINLKGFVSIDVYEAEKSNNYKKINLHSYMGISIPSGTIYKINYTSDTFIAELLDYKVDNDIENLKKDII